MQSQQPGAEHAQNCGDDSGLGEPPLQSSVPDSYTLLLFIVESYLNVSVLMSCMYVCVCACMYQELLKNHNKCIVCLRTLGD